MAGASAASIAWQDYFTDPQLRELIAQALLFNRDLRIASLRTREAQAAYGIQRADLFPTIAPGMSVSRGRVPGDLNLTGRSMMENDYQVGVGFSNWEIDFWGRVRSLQDAALQDYLASDEGRRAATLSLIAQVANAYLSLRELDERVALARSTVASREESLRIFTRRFEVGSTSRLDLTQVQTLLTQAQSLSAQLEQSRALQAHALAQLTGGPVPPDQLASPCCLDDAMVAPKLQAGLPSELLANRPDIVAAEHQLRAAHANIGAARAAFFPRVTLTGNFGTASAQFEGLFDTGSRAWTFAPAVSVPIFDGGRLRANLRLSELRRDIAVASYESAVQGAFRDVSDAMSSVQWLARLRSVQESALSAQTERARLAKLRYDSGAAAFLEVLDAQRDLLSAQQQLVQTRRALLSARVGLYSALGGGSMELAAAPAKAVSPTH